VDELVGPGLGAADGFDDCAVYPVLPCVFVLVREYVDRELDVVDARAENVSYGRTAVRERAWEGAEDLSARPFPNVVAAGLGLLEPESFQSKSEKSAIDFEVGARATLSNEVRENLTRDNNSSSRPWPRDVGPGRLFHLYSRQAG
jgi:hypothetical protein